MRVTFKASPELLKVCEIGESIRDADDSFRRQFSILVLVAVRSREIPVRNKNGFKIPPESLDITERKARDFAERHFLERLGDFDADLQRARESAAAQPWIQQHYDINAKLQTYANEYEKYKHHIEPEIQSETNRLLDDWYRDASVLVSEVAEWFCKAHDFAGQMAVSNSVGTGEIARKLANWFDNPLNDLPPPLRKIAELYIPRWSELSGADRRARANDADQKVQETIGARFEQAEREREQAKNDPKQVAERLVAWYHETLDAKTWWNLSAITPREAAMLLCQFNPHDDNYDPLSITTDETSPEDFKRLLRVFEDAAQSQSPRTLSDWHDIARDKRLKYHSWIDAFRQAMAENPPIIDSLPEVFRKASEKNAKRPGTKGLVAWQSEMLENWPKIAEYQKKPPARQVMKWLKDYGSRDVFPAGQPLRDSLKWIDGYGQPHSLTINRLSTVLSEWRKAGKIPA